MFQNPPQWHIGKKVSTFFYKQFKHFNFGLYKANKVNRNATVGTAVLDVFFLCEKKSHTSSHVVNWNANTLNQMLNKRLSTVIPFKPLRWKKWGAKVNRGASRKWLWFWNQGICRYWIVHPRKPTNESESSLSLCRSVTSHPEFVSIVRYTRMVNSPHSMWLQMNHDSPAIETE